MIGHAKEVYSGGIFPLSYEFGLRNAPATFQRFMNVTAVLEGCVDYLDDAVVCRQTWEEHLVGIGALFHYLAQPHQTVSVTKLESARVTVMYLGKEVG